MAKLDIFPISDNIEERRQQWMTIECLMDHGVNQIVGYTSVSEDLGVDCGRHGCRKDETDYKAML